MRLIDADALREELKRFFPTEVLDGIEPKTLFAQIMHDIDNAPAVERLHGEWKKIKTDSWPYFECSVCHHCVDIKYNEINEHLCEIVKDNFCPNCGADMRGK